MTPTEDGFETAARDMEEIRVFTEERGADTETVRPLGRLRSFYSGYDRENPGEHQDFHVYQIHIRITRSNPATRATEKK